MRACIAVSEMVELDRFTNLFPKLLVGSLPSHLPAHQDSLGPSKPYIMGLKVPVDTQEGADPEHDYPVILSQAGY